MRAAVTSRGHLEEGFPPAIYFDASVLIDYWMAEGMGRSDQATDDAEQHTRGLRTPLDEVVHGLLRPDARLNKVAEIRRKLLNQDPKAVPVTTHAALWEMQEWYAESALKNVAAAVMGTGPIQRKGKKEIGDYLKKGFTRWQAEAEADQRDHVIRDHTSGLELLMHETWLSFDFEEAHGLQGILVVDTVNFRWPPARSSRNARIDPYLLAYLQIGMADIMHVLLANHLGCRYFASFDSDFSRAKEFIEESGLKVLATPEEILSAM